jgi:hypothetical protein
LHLILYNIPSFQTNSHPSPPIVFSGSNDIDFDAKVNEVDNDAPEDAHEAAHEATHIDMSAATITAAKPAAKKTTAVKAVVPPPPPPKNIALCYLNTCDTYVIAYYADER